MNNKECGLNEKDMLKQIDKYMNELNNNPKETKINILSEVSEKLRFTGSIQDKLRLSSFDYVNKPQINKKIIKKMKKHKIRILLPKNKKTISKNSTRVESLEINKKLKILEKKIRTNKLTKTKVSFILSHGTLMDEIYIKTSQKKLKAHSIKNLDILYISVKDKKYNKIKIFKFPKYNGLLDLIEKNINNYHYLFIRHCHACHNLKNNNQLIKGIKIIKGEITGKNTTGSSSICLSKTPKMINKMNLIPIFKYLKKNKIKYSFNSSIIFRAVLTMSLIITKHNNEL